MPDRKHIDAKVCGEFEEAILDSFDQTLSETERQKVDDHVADCMACRMFWNEQQRLDAALAAKLRPSVLPADFRQRIVERAQAESHAVSDSVDVGRADLEAAWAELQRHSRQQMVWSALDGVGYATLAGLAVFGGLELLGESSLLAGLSGQEVVVYAGVALGAAAVLVSWWIGFHDRIRHVLNWE